MDRSVRRDDVFYAFDGRAVVNQSFRLAFCRIAPRVTEIISTADGIDIWLVWGIGIRL